MSDTTERFQQMATDVASLKEQMEFVVDFAKRTDYTLNGNGTPGLKSRMVTVEKNQERASKYVGAGIVAAIGAAVTALWSLLTNHK